MMLVYVLSAPCFIWEQAVSITTEEEVRGEKRNIFNVEAEVEVETAEGTNLAEVMDMASDGEGNASPLGPDF